jgi:hypothetical protein
MSKPSEAGKGALQLCTTTFKVTLFQSRMNRQGRVLYLEAGKDFVDTIFSFLVLPVGTILHILAQGKDYSHSRRDFFSAVLSN